MTRNELLRQLREHSEIARKLVEALPEWKRRLLEQSSQPTLDEPRKPIRNDQVAGGTLSAQN